MRVAGPHHVELRDIVEFAGQEAVHHAGRNVQATQHHRHGRGKVLAVATALLEQKAGDRIVASERHIQGVAILGAQVLLQQQPSVIGIAGGGW